MFSLQTIVLNNISGEFHLFFLFKYMFFIPDFFSKNKYCEVKIKIPGVLDAPYLAMEEHAISQTIVSKKDNDVKS